MAALSAATGAPPAPPLVAVTGVSGAGKSTLVNDILFPAASRELNGSSARVGRHRQISGLGPLDHGPEPDQQGQAW
jgi:excinuclease ABC subunit A